MTTYIPLVFLSKPSKLEDYKQAAIDEAKRVSANLYKLSRPSAPGSDVTQYYCGWVQHPDTGDVLLALPESEDIPVSTQANLNIISDMINPYVTAGLVPSDVVTKVQQDTVDSLGKRVTIYSLLPDFWKSRALTREQAIAQGFLKEVSP